MNHERTPTGEPATPDPQSDAACERCGRFGAFAVAGRWLCPDCYTNSGSCCPEFGAFDAATAAVESAERRSERDSHNAH